MNSQECGPINIGNPNEFTIRELAEKVRQLVNPDLKFAEKPLPQDDPLQRQPVISLAKDKLDWLPCVELDQGLPKTIDWFRSHLKTI